MSDMHCCQVCRNLSLAEVEQYKQVTRVTSDCKPFDKGGRLAVCMACGAVQKPTDDIWQAEVDKIYKQYTPYYSSGGKEQFVFDPILGTPSSRSSIILNRLMESLTVRATGSVLDIGSGNGALLSAFSSIRPQWVLHGHDLSDINITALESIPGFQKLYTCPLPEIPGSYDIVTLIHSLEHFVSPLENLRAIKHLIKPDGLLLIQVPNAEATPFDLLVADHVTHFTLHHLMRLLYDTGYGLEVVANNWVTKELTVVARPQPEPVISLPEAPAPEDVLRRVTAQINWLNSIVKDAENVSRETDQFGLFGTSIAATWLYGQLGDLVKFFVDEDPSCIGRAIDCKTIYAPSKVPSAAVVYVMLIPHVAQAVAARLSGFNIDLRLPPEIQH